MNRTVQKFVADHTLPEDMGNKEEAKKHMRLSLVFAELCEQFPGFVGWMCNKVHERKVCCCCPRAMRLFRMIVMNVDVVARH